jgi:uncharacterized protein YecE (DUF72 family)
LEDGVKKVSVGTSGWTYRDWKGIFYPPELPQKEWFNFYKKHFDTVEINATFYRTPKEKIFEGWNRKGGEGFLFAVKMSRLLTHRKKLLSPQPLLDDLLEKYRILGDSLGPILIQLPPSLHFDPERLLAFLKLLPDDLLFAVEFRHKSWFRDETYEILDSNGIGFVSFHHPYLDCPKIATGKLIYLRFHGTEGLYRGRYPPSILKEWIQFILKNVEENRKAFVYFNNDFNADAIWDAIQLKKLIDPSLTMDASVG